MKIIGKCKKEIQIHKNHEADRFGLPLFFILVDKKAFPGVGRLFATKIILSVWELNLLNNQGKHYKIWQG